MRLTDIQRLLLTRAVRGLVDGLVSVSLATYLALLGFSPFQVGAIVTGTLLGSAAVTLSSGLLGHRLARRRLLMGAAALMAATGLGFSCTTSFVAVLLVAVVGTLNPSSGDVSLFLPTEQAALAQLGSGANRTTLFAWYNLAGTFSGALGALLSALPAWWAIHRSIPRVVAERGMFLLYAAAAVLVAAVYRGLSPAVEVGPRSTGRRPLAESRAIVLRLAVLFSLDSFGGGFVVQSLLVLWLVQRFHLSATTLASVFFAAGTLSACSQALSPWVARRMGLIRTMVFTHLPANLFLVLAAFMPSAAWAIAFLLLRMAVSQMDVPARQAFVMAVVPPEERAAAASVTNVPRSLAAGLSPLLAGALMEHTLIGWPLVLGGGLKIVYDLLLLSQFRSVVPREAGVR